jgi:Uma2 family endonuclease
MSAGAPPSTLMTTEQMLALPENGMDRELIRGELREKPMTRRNRRHSRSMVRIGTLLDNWLRQQPEPRGEIVGGEAGFRLSHNPDTTVGIDVAYVSAELASKTLADAFLYDGPPVLAVEILSPSDSKQDIHDKVQAYKDADVALIWIVDPFDRTVLVHRAGEEPEMFNVRQDLSGEPHLPGFRVPVTEIFGF